MKKTAVLIALAQAGVLALAQSSATAPVATARDPSAGQFVCGGISQPDAESMKAQARNHDLMLTFAESTGAYLADVDVQIADSRGHVVLSGTCEGPIMLVDLPRAGTWRVTASVNGQTRTQTVSTARGRTARATLVWPPEAS
ncbi:MAG TPA: carboxypeptidase regulatory-like domain-containing protein [Ramlibacter sp.]|nr:carboxypeptidase regulatory-like domain-containing protein [Ramlibacter sp.]